MPISLAAYQRSQLMQTRLDTSSASLANESPGICETCRGEGSVGTVYGFNDLQESLYDACPDCTRRAEQEWKNRR